MTTKRLHNTPRLALFCLFISAFHYSNCFAHIHCSHLHNLALETHYTNANCYRSRSNAFSGQNNGFTMCKPCPPTKHAASSKAKPLRHDLCQHAEDVLIKTHKSSGLTPHSVDASPTIDRVCTCHNITLHQHRITQAQHCPSANLLKTPHRNNTMNTHDSNSTDTPMHIQNSNQVSVILHSTNSYLLTHNLVRM